MNGVHDIGGMDGFGPVNPEPGEPVFHEPWEGRVFALNMLGAGRKHLPIDALRHNIERLDPVRYLASSYYERWLATMAEAIIEAGTLSPDEIEARMRELEAESDATMPRRENPAQAEGVIAALRAGNPATRKVRKPARFTPGQRVITRNLNPPGHTRLPRYARDKHGVIVLHHGAHVFPDTNAHGLGEHPQHLYTVRIAARDLWGSTAEPKAYVLLDLWESYLDDDRSSQSLANLKTKPVARASGNSKVETKARRQPKIVVGANAKAKPKAAPKAKSEAPLRSKPSSTTASSKSRRRKRSR
jgi:nitrile hydratase